MPSASSCSGRFASALADRLLAIIGRESVRELRLSAPEMWIASAQLELGQGEVAAARRALATIEKPARIDDVRVHVRYRQALAAAAAAALALLPALAGPSPVRWRPSNCTGH